MGNLAYIDELGIGSDEPTNDDGELNNDTQDGLNDSDDSTPTDDESNKSDTDTERLMKQITALEKRISDKDAYINELRKESQKKGDAKASDGEEDEDFWSNPEAHYKQLKEQQKIQQMQIAEAVYANTVDNYWKTVNANTLREAIAGDDNFADEFNRSREPYRIAYEYLTQKSQKKDSEMKSLKEQIRAELMKEMGIKKGSVEAPPSIAKMSSSSGQNRQLNEDGFASVFGSDY